MERLCTEALDYYANLVREFYANAKRRVNDDEEEFVCYETIGVKSLVKGVDIVIDEKLINKLFNLLQVKREKLLKEHVVMVGDSRGGHGGMSKIHV